MKNTETVYENEWGMVLDRPEAGLIEIRWFDSTQEMTARDFQSFLSAFAEALTARPGRSVLVDAAAFRMAREHANPKWRDDHIIPLYNAAQVRRFAFQMPIGMPLVGMPPAPEGPARFPTGYFGSRRDALRWLEVQTTGEGQ
jgi:hypothetical protein